MNLALDTNAYSDFMRGDPRVVKIIQSSRRIHLPLIVIAELRAGFAAGSRETTNAGVLQQFLQQPGTGILYPDDQTTHHYASLFLQLRRKAVSIPTNDLWIAALAVQHSLILCTSDAHFQHFPQLPKC